MKFAMMNVSDEFLQDMKAQYPDLPAKFYWMGSDPANGRKLMFVQSDALEKDGFNGFVTAKVDQPNTVTFAPVPNTSHDETTAQAMAVMFAKTLSDEHDKETEASSDRG